MPLVPRLLLAVLLAASFAGPAAPVAYADQPAAVAVLSDGDLVQMVGDEKIHLISRGERHWIADTVSLQQINPDFTRLRRIGIDELRAIPAGKPIHAGPLIRDNATGRVFLLTKETDWPAPRKHWINDLDSFTKLGFAWEDVDLAWPTPPARYAYAPALTFAPVSREPAPVTAPEGTFTGIPAWRLQTQDDRLYQALAVAYTYNPDWRTAISGQFAPTGTWIEWGPLPPDVSGFYSETANRIVLNQALQGEALGVIASTLTHEVLHAVTKHGSDVAACLAEEATAFSYEARTWSRLPTNLRSGSAQAQFLDALAGVYASQGTAGLQQAVAQEPAYRQECATNAAASARLIALG